MSRTSQATMAMHALIFLCVSLMVLSATQKMSTGPKTLLRIQFAKDAPSSISFHHAISRLEKDADSVEWLLVEPRGADPWISVPVRLGADVKEISICWQPTSPNMKLGLDWKTEDTLGPAGTLEVPSTGEPGTLVNTVQIPAPPNGMSPLTGLRIKPLNGDVMKLSFIELRG